MTTNNNTPWGLQPVQRFGSSDYRGNLQVFLAPTTNAIFIGDPVIRITGTGTRSGFDGVYQKADLITAGSNHKVTGVCVGFLGSSPNGAFLGFGLGQGPFYKVTNKASQFIVVDTDPNSMYVVQCTGTPAVTTIGQNGNLVSGTGSTVTGWSGWQMSATIADSATAQLTIMGVAPEVDNNPTLQFTKFLVRINNSTEIPGVAGI